MEEMSIYEQRVADEERDLGESTAQNTTIYHLATMLTTSKKVLFPGHNYVITASMNDDPSLAGALAIIKVSGHQYRWLKVVMTWKYDMFKSGWHGGYLVDSVLLPS